LQSSIIFCDCEAYSESAKDCELDNEAAGVEEEEEVDEELILSGSILYASQVVLLLSGSSTISSISHLIIYTVDS
jgi:hypothetical protein